MIDKTWYRKHRLSGAALLSVLLLFCIIPLLMAQDQSSRSRNLTRSEPAFSNLFNCMCRDNCGKNLSDCSCSVGSKGNAQEMKKTLRNLDRKRLSRSEQLDFMKKKYGKLALAVPEKEGSDLIFYYVLPPAVIFLGVLFVGGLGWYWVQNGREELSRN